MLINNTNNPSIKCNPSGEEGISQKNERDTGDSKGEKKRINSRLDEIKWWKQTRKFRAEKSPTKRTDACQVTKEQTNERTDERTNCKVMNEPWKAQKE